MQILPTIQEEWLSNVVRNDCMFNQLKLKLITLGSERVKFSGVKPGGGNWIPNAHA